MKDTGKLEKLHAKLTDVLLEIVESGGEECTPAMLTVARGFLKDNEITCNMQDDEQGSALQEALEKKKSRRLASVTPIQQEG